MNWTLSTLKTSVHQKTLSRWMDKEAVGHIYNGILLGHKKECIWVSSNEVDEPRAYYTERNKSEREKQMSYINAYVWNLEGWYCLQSSNGDKDIENRLMDKGRGEEGEGEINGESSTDAYTLTHVNILTYVNR